MAEVVDLGTLTPADRLRVRRILSGLRQWELAGRLGVHVTTLSLAENGRLGGAKIEALDAKLAQLLTGGGVPPTT